MGKAVSAVKSQEEALRLAREFTVKAHVKCKRHGLELVSAFIVGSRARGDYRVDSDIDIVLVIKGVERMNHLERIEFFSDILLEVPGEIEYRVYTPEEWSKEGSLLMKELRKEAIRIWPKT